MRFFVFFSAALLLFISSLSAQSNVGQQTISGRITDTAGHPLPTSSIVISELNLMATTGPDGRFVLMVPTFTSKEKFTLEISHTGKQPYQQMVQARQSYSLNIVLKDRSYSLPDVQVAATRSNTGNSNSSILFDRTTIENIQPLSLADVFNYLPGKIISPPNVLYKTFLTLRSQAVGGDFGGAYGMNNAFGTTLYVDGSPVTNNANIQAVNITRNGMVGSTNQIGVGNRLVNGVGRNNTNDFANNGVDLRQISVESIESIEVVSGVASARYGDYADGAVIINRQAGKSPLRLTSRVREGTFNISASKGFLLGKKWGSISGGFDYLKSNEDPRDKFKSYNRVGGNVAWTYATKGRHPFRNTITLDYSTNLDRLKEDPDDGDHSASSFKNYNYRINNRSSWQLNKKWLKKIGLTASYSGGKQESFDQVYVNTTTVRQITVARETGLHEGYFTPGFYYAVRHLIGRPVNANGNLELNNYFATGKVFHNIIAGGNISYSGNRGPGLIEDPNTPRTNNYNAGITNRPNTYNRNLFTQTYGGVYAEDRMNTRLFDKALTVSTGVRGDIQNKFFVLAPRVSTTYQLQKNLKVNLAYGISSKAPSLLQINPGDAYYDLPVVSYYTNNPAENYYLAYTKVIQIQNLQLKPYTSYITEAGLNWTNDLFTTTLNAFYKQTRNGYSSDLQRERVTVPTYTVTPVSGSKPILTQNGTKDYNVTYNLVNNALSTNTQGLELIVNTKKIQAIQTSFSFNTSFYYTGFYNKNRSTGDLTQMDANILAGRTAVVGVYGNTNYTSYALKSGMMINTHIPSLRMIVSISGDILWMDKTVYDQSSLYPIGYYTKDFTYVPFEKNEGQTTVYNYLWRGEDLYTLYNNIPNIYSNWHLRVGKEIGSHLRFSFNAYNFLYLNENKRKNMLTYSGTVSDRLFALRTQPSFGAELLFSF